MYMCIKYITTLLLFIISKNTSAHPPICVNQILARLLFEIKAVKPGKLCKLKHFQRASCQ